MEEEKVYKVVRATGAWNIAIGIATIILGLGAGIMLVISGGKLLLTEFEGSDAASEKTMGSEILEAIDNVRKQRVEEMAEEAENLEDAESETGSEAGSMNVSDTGEADDKEVNDDESLAVYSEEDMGNMYEQETVPVSTAMTAAETSMQIIRHRSEKVPHLGIGIIFPILGFVFAVLFAVAAALSVINKG